MPLKVDSDDVRQEVALQRLLGRRVSARIVRRRMAVEEARRGVAEGSVPPPAEPTIRLDELSPVEYPLLVDKFLRRLPVAELLRIHNCRNRRTLARKVQAELDRLRGELT